ncbi:HAD hydrolase family protein [Algibacter sp. 2305UL17-15]|uniref:cytidylyltransferase domain-containing protein n=1 Tax=Algibacter sp. 2305UL17-15 TaxID=3231268 RepID=UPI003458488F
MSKTIGFIPLRKGSKGIPNKNKRKMAGRPLFSWVLTEAIFSNLDEIVVYTDDTIVANYIRENYNWTDKVVVMARSTESAEDTASTEFAILEYCEKIDYNFDTFCLLQATSPLTTYQDINASLSKLSEGFDAALSVVKTHRFAWQSNGTPINYDYNNRPRRQDFEGLLIENGAVYVTSKKALQKSNNRISGNIAIVEMPEDSYHEIDDETDWKMVEQLLIDRLIRTKTSKPITHLFLDVDGVFTDGKVAFTEKGELSKNFDMRDGMGLEIIRELGVEVIVMTSENSPLVAARMKKLKINDVYLGVKDKYAQMLQLVEKYKIDTGNIAYLGDDINDLATMCFVGWSMAPNNAMTVIKRYSDIVLNSNGGSGAIREACDLIIKYNKRYE